MRVQHKSIIVTGAGNGIGEGIAKRLAAEGGKVIVNDINEAGGQRVVAEIMAAGGTAAFFKADVTQSADVKALVDEALRLHGRLDVVVNNAGWTHRNRPMLEVSEEEFDKVYAINMKSIYLSAIHAVPALRQAGGGSIINIASTAGLRPRPGLTWYNGSKGAVIITSKSMAVELGPDNIRVNCINPVFNPTPAWPPSLRAARWTRRAAPSSWPPFRWAASPPRSTWPMRRCTWRAKRHRSSAACALRWMAGAAYKQARQANRRRGTP